ncbi:MAG TPA: hypothetical protein VKU02_08130 [Gemmataceae bacterium]|nr:hypothetical protein [Gemmataceae bacterium]
MRREDQVGQLVLQATAGHRQAMPADARRVAVTQTQARPEQLRHSTSEADGPLRRGHRHLVGPPQQVVEALPVPDVLERGAGTDGTGRRGC